MFEGVVKTRTEPEEKLTTWNGSPTGDSSERVSRGVVPIQTTREFTWPWTYKQKLREGWEEGRRDSPAVQAFIFVSGKNRSGLGLGLDKKLRRGDGGERASKAVFPHPPSFSPSPSPSCQGLILRSHVWRCNHWPVVFGRKIKMANQLWVTHHPLTFDIPASLRAYRFPYGMPHGAP